MIINAFDEIKSWNIKELKLNKEFLIASGKTYLEHEEAFRQIAKK
jgi:hypothetical protein